MRLRDGVKSLIISFWAWSAWGRESCHSRLVGAFRVKIVGRWAKKASQIKKINMRRAINEISDPMEEIAFQQV